MMLCFVTLVLLKTYALQMMLHFFFLSYFYFWQQSNLLLRFLGDLNLFSKFLISTIRFLGVTLTLNMSFCQPTVQLINSIPH
jgi:hypothetical protein